MCRFGHLSFARTCDAICEAIPLSLMFVQVSRSFAAVIQQLPKVLTVDIMVFYLVLRGLDTVEDDMTAFDDVEVCQQQQPAPKTVSRFPFPRAAVEMFRLPQYKIY